MMNTPIPQLLSELVRLPSVNPMGRDPDSAICLEHRVTEYLERFFRDLGVPHDRQTVASGRDNIIARYEPPSPPAYTVMWEVHQDTVPVDGMTIDPFGGEIRDGRLYGRGACDVKGGMASMLAAFARLVRERPAGSLGVVLACTVDEENTFLGVQHLAQSNVKADAAVVAEPTGLKIVDAHKGAVRWRVRTTGRACHSSRPDRGINAVYRMGHVLTAIEEYAARLLESTPEPRLGPPTMNVGQIHGGVSVNTVPDECVIEIDRRLLPGEDGDAAYRDFDQFLRDHPSIDFEVTCDKPWLYCPALGADGSDDIKRRLGAAIDAVIGAHEVEAVPYGTDASTLALGGMPAVVFGPGSIDQAHTKDEFIDLEQLERAAEILYRLAVPG